MSDFNDTLIQEIEELEQKTKSAVIPPELLNKIQKMLFRLKRSVNLGNYSEEFEKTAHYIDWIVSLPWAFKTEDRLDLDSAKSLLDSKHYGLEEVKERILEYLAVLKLKTQQGQNAVARAPILLLVGLVGTGKTTFAISLAEAMGRKFVRIPIGGLGSSRDLRGQSRLHLEAEPGYIIKALRRAGTKNPVILLDEIDRVDAAARADVMGVMVELLDPEQNSSFVDHYLDFPFDLSEVLFIGTANNTGNIATAVMDRLEPISMPSYSDDQKTVIAKQYILPSAVADAGLKNEDILIEEELWPRIVRPLGYDAGIRTLQRTIKGMVRKVAKRKVEGMSEVFELTSANIDEYMPSYQSEII